MTDTALVFAHAEVVVGDQIREAVARTDGNAERALCSLWREGRAP
jgi:hypothetical protein